MVGSAACHAALQVDNGGPTTRNLDLIYLHYLSRYRIVWLQLKENQQGIYEVERQQQRRHAAQHPATARKSNFELYRAGASLQSPTLHARIMDRAAYRLLVERLTLPLSAWPHFAAIASMAGVSVDTVFSIYSQEVQNRVLRTNHVVKAAIVSHAQRYLAGK